MQIKYDFHELEEFAERLCDDYMIETSIMTIAQNIARVLHQHLLQYTPVDTGNLRKMWSADDNLAFMVETVDNGYQVTLVNTAQNQKGEKYGEWVNDGHKTTNGGWVMGRFFVEKSIIATEDKCNKLIYDELKKWWKWCING